MWSLRRLSPVPDSDPPFFPGPDIKVSPHGEPRPVGRMDSRHPLMKAPQGAPGNVCDALGRVSNPTVVRWWVNNARTIPRVWSGLGDAARSVASQWWYVGAVTTTFFGWAPPLRLLPFFLGPPSLAVDFIDAQHRPSYKKNTCDRTMGSLPIRYMQRSLKRAVCG